MIKTIITNKLHTGRTVRWADVWVGPNSSVVLDGAYPYAGKARSAVAMCAEELKSGAIELTYVTDIPCITSLEFATKGVQARAEKKVKKAIAIDTAEAEKKERQARRAEKAAKKAEADEAAKKAEAAVESKESEGEKEVFKRGSIADAMGDAIQVAGTVSEVISHGDTVKLAKRMDMDVSVVKTNPKAHKHVIDPLLQAGEIVGDNWANVTDAAQVILTEAGVSKAEAMLIKGSGQDGKIINKDAKAYLAKKNGK